MTDPTDRDARIASALRALDPDAELDDLRFERLARRVGAAGAERLRRSPTARRSVALARRDLVRVGMAALIAAGCLLALTLAPGDPAPGTHPEAGLTEPGLHAPDRGSLFVATAGAVPEDDFLRGLWGRVDAETLLAASVHP